MKRSAGKLWAKRGAPDVRRRWETRGVLRRTVDTRDGNYHGDMIGQWLDELIREGRAGGYESVELKWWDICEGWVTADARLVK